MPKFKGKLAELQALLASYGAKGDWKTPTSQQHQFRAEDGAMLNWWPSTGTVSFQGSPTEKETLEGVFNAVMDSRSIPATSSTPTLDSAAKPSQQMPSEPRRIFVVHGHDDAAREQLERILLILGLEHFVLANTSGAGLTIIESLEKQIGQKPEAEFGIVLMTLDDMGYAKREGGEAVKPRARQNVVLEMGMLISSLGRHKVVILVKGHIESPSDASGIIYLHFNDHVREIVPKLTERLRLAGFQLDPSACSRASS